MKTVVALFERPQDAVEAVSMLQTAGFAPQSVNVLSSVGALWRYLGCTPARILAKDFAIGAALGIAIYALFGVMVAVSEVTLGFSQVVAVEALLVFVLLGVFVGGFLGAAFGLGAAKQESRCLCTRAPARRRPSRCAHRRRARRPCNGSAPADRGRRTYHSAREMRMRVRVFSPHHLRRTDCQPGHVGLQRCWG